MFHSRKASSRSTRWLGSVSLVCVAAFGTACKKNDGETAPGGYVQAGVGTAGASGLGGATAFAGAGGGTAAAGGAAAAGAGGAAGPTGPIAQRLDATAGLAIKPLLDQLAKTETQAGSKAIGETLVGNFATGQSLEVPIQLQPNKCYTVIAASLPPVTEVNVQLQLVTPIPGVVPVLAIDQDTGASAVLGRKTTCYRWMFGTFPASAKVVVQVAGGSGLVAAQAYEK
jgi:hypothetical protein